MMKEENQHHQHHQYQYHHHHHHQQQQRVPLQWLKPYDKFDSNSNVDNANVDILPSFIDLQRKTQQTLYNGSAGKDKSPKGSVDKPIEDFVNLINHHCSYTTLSSCSGRISLFDPKYHNQTLTTTTTNVVNDYDAAATGDISSSSSPTTITSTSNQKSTTTTNFGKGSTGGWRFVSHYPVDDYQTILDYCCYEKEINNNDNNNDTSNTISHFVDQNPCNMMMFQMEPMLLHVGAASLEHGRLLLQLALECGYRESGLIVTDSRVTVAIRSYSLSLKVPLFAGSITTKNHNHNHQNPPVGATITKEYIMALIDQANQRLLQTWKQQQRLYDIIESTLFHFDPPTIIASVSQRRRRRMMMTKKESNSSSSGDNNKTNTTTMTRIPPGSLSLWQAATVATIVKNNNDPTTTTFTDDVDIWSFGGYGIGPITEEEEDDDANLTTTKKKGGGSGAKRSSAIYKLEYRNNQWSSQWKAVMVAANLSSLSSPTQQQQSCDYPSNFSIIDSLPDCQGMAACHFNNSSSSNNNNRWIVLWGGRQSPKRPMDALYVWDYQNLQLFSVSSKIQGCDGNDTPPAPRWGHSMVKATINNKDCLIVIGGRNETHVFDDIYVLHYDDDYSHHDEGNSSSGGGGCNHENNFYWEKVTSIKLPTPKFHHTSVVIQNNIVCVFGGLQSISTVIYPLTSSSIKDNNNGGINNNNNNNDNDSVWFVFCIDEIRRQRQQQTGSIVVPSTTAKVMDIANDVNLTSTTGQPCRRRRRNNILPSLFGSSSVVCNNLVPTSTTTCPPVVLISGGVNSVDVTSINNLNDDEREEEQHVDDDDDDDTAPLHCVLILPDVNRNRVKITTLPVRIVPSASRIEGDNDDTGNKEEKERSCSFCDFGSLVHHSCVQVSLSSSSLTKNDFLSVGGGVPSFAFGNTFAKSSVITLKIQDESVNEEEGKRNGESSPSLVGTTAIPSSSSSSSTVSSSVVKSNDTATTNNKKSSMTSVVFVAPENAKIVKTQLESRGWLDKGYRMTKMHFPSSASTTTSEQQQQQQQIAIPITAEGWQELSTVIEEIASSQEDMPASSSADVNDHITKHVVTNNDDDRRAWMSTMIIGHSRMMEMPFSTARFASKGKRR